MESPMTIDPATLNLTLYPHLEIDPSNVSSHAVIGPTSEAFEPTMGENNDYEALHDNALLELLSANLEPDQAARYAMQYAGPNLKERMFTQGTACRSTNGSGRSRDTVDDDLDGEDLASVYKDISNQVERLCLHLSKTPRMVALLTKPLQSKQRHFAHALARVKNVRHRTVGEGQLQRVLLALRPSYSQRWLVDTMSEELSRKDIDLTSIIITQRRSKKTSRKAFSEIIQALMIKAVPGSGKVRAMGADSATISYDTPEEAVAGMNWLFRWSYDQGSLIHAEFVSQALQHATGQVRPMTSKTPSWHSSTAESVVSSTPSLVARYFDKKGDKVIYILRLQELDDIHGRNLLEREFLRDRGDEIAIPGAEFERTYERQRAEFQYELDLARIECQKLEEQCLACGLDISTYGKPESCLEKTSEIDAASLIVSNDPSCEDIFVDSWMQDIPSGSNLSDANRSWAGNGDQNQNWTADGYLSSLSTDDTSAWYSSTSMISDNHDTDAPPGRKRARVARQVGAFPCTYPECTLVFDRAGDLKKHERIHKPEEYKNYCNECGKAFLWPKDLKRHCSTHKGKNVQNDTSPRKCDVCHQTFRFRSDYVRHTRIHPTYPAFPPPNRIDEWLRTSGR